MAKKLFGTDGIRGVAGQPPLDPATISALGLALADDLKRHDLGGLPVLLGMDTRESGPGIAARLSAALSSGGIETRFAGVITTPGIAYLTRTGEFSAGIMISASHNPFEDNGIKVFARTGFKLPDAEEHAIEEEILRLAPAVQPTDAPELKPSYSCRPYVDYLLSTMTTLLSGRRVVLDCGNGGASALAPELFREAGAEVTTICDRPDGRNINLNCGALHLDNVRAKVLESGADAGIAFDGDADRALMVSHTGRIVDGDAIMLIAARRLQADGHLKGNVVISTVMSNLGLEKALGRLGIEMVRTAVGDKYVLEEMLRRDAALGGEQSGHIIFREYATTGDGMLTALKVMATSVREGSTLDELAADLTVYPQLLKNVRVKERRGLHEMPLVAGEIRAVEEELDGSGRVLVRFSGTELLLRVMVEGEERSRVEALTDRIVGAIHAELG